MNKSINIHKTLLPKTLKTLKNLLTIFLLMTIVGCSSFIEERSLVIESNQYPESSNLQTKSENVAKIKQHKPPIVIADASENYLETDILNIISKELSLFHFENEPLVKNQIEWLLKNPNYLKSVFERSKPYLFYIYSKIREKNLPIELTLLPIIESTYDPLAYSQSHASGLWQFIPSTAQYLGLERTLWFDARRDVVDSTDVAIDYLLYLNGKFSKDWLLTLAAYNGGEGTLSKAIEKNKDASKAIKFWDLQLPNETENYVPKFLALAHIIKNKDILKIDLPSIPNQKVFEIIELRDQIEISTIVEVSDLDYETFTKFNPGFRRSVTPPNKKSNILLPIKSADTFKMFITQENPDNWLPFSEYQIKPGDTLSEIALDKDSSIKSIRDINNLSGDILRIGSIIKVPHNRGTPLTSKRLMSTQMVSHEIHLGETLSKIAKIYGTTVKSVMLENALKSSNIKAGDTLQIQIMTNKLTQQHLRKIYYKVKPGDSLYLIAKRFSVSIKDIKKSNALANSKYIHPGQTLVLEVDAMRI